MRVSELVDDDLKTVTYEVIRTAHPLIKHVGTLAEKGGAAMTEEDFWGRFEQYLVKAWLYDAPYETPDETSPTPEGPAAMTLGEMAERVLRVLNQSYCCEDDSGPGGCREGQQALETLRELLEWLQRTPVSA